MYRVALLATAMLMSVLRVAPVRLSDLNVSPVKACAYCVYHISPECTQAEFALKKIHLNILTQVWVQFEFMPRCSHQHIISTFQKNWFCK